jgi:hypothetical protein
MLTGVTASVSTNFNNTQNLSVTAYNLNGSTGPVTIDSSSSLVIYDKPSYTFINTFPTSIPTILETNSEKVGCRVWSNVDSTPVNSNGNAVIPPNYTYNGYSYSQFKYNQSWSIVSSATSITTPDYPVNTNIDTSQEIQIYNGHYGTGKTETGGTGINGYINYSSYYNNSLNYTLSSRLSTDYRYTTFVWQFNFSGGGINNYIFTFKNIKVDGSTPSLNGTIAPYSLGTNIPRFFLFYRTGGPIDNENVESSLSSIWIDGNSNAGTELDNNTAKFNSNLTPLSGNNYQSSPTSNNIIRIPASRLSKINGSDLVVTVSPIPISDTTYNAYIYCRFGNAMSYNVTYESVTLSISSQ